MRNDVDVYDLGIVEIDEAPAPARSTPASTKPPTPVPLRRPQVAPASGTRRGPRAGPALTGSLSLFLPGTGQLVAGDLPKGLFFATSIAFALAVLHALVTTLDRVIPTFELLGIPPALAGGALACLLYAAAALHVSAILGAYSAAPDSFGAAPHPVLAALASAIIPGWGQILVGHRRRAACFIGATWLIAFAWLIVTPVGLGVLSQLGLALSRGAREGWGPIALVTAPVLLWSLAIYDAAIGAAMRRRFDI